MAALRTIPTHVGRTTTIQRGYSEEADHPHARGENAFATPIEPLSTGPSPRTWGEPSRERPCIGGRRTIPTHVGRTTTK